MNLIEINGLTKKYGRKTALDNISLNIESGKIVGLLGPNGSGKTTLIKLLAGILSCPRETVLIDEYNVGTETKKFISYLPDSTYIDESMKVSQIITFFKDFYFDFNDNMAISMLGNLNIDLNAKFKTLSKGMKEKVQLVLVMSRRAKLYLLDEPIAGVDPATRDYILNTIIKNYNSQATILISTHLIADVEGVLDDVIFINEGKIGLVSSVDDIRKNYGKSVDEYFREVYRC